MRKRIRVALAVGSLALLLVLVLSAVISLELAIVLMGILQIGILVLLVDSRPALISTVQSTARRYEERLSGRFGTLVERLVTKTLGPTAWASGGRSE